MRCTFPCEPTVDVPAGHDIWRAASAGAVAAAALRPQNSPHVPVWAGLRGRQMQQAMVRCVRLAQAGQLLGRAKGVVVAPRGRKLRSRRPAAARRRPAGARMHFQGNEE